jgi:hypothetical protein
LFGGSNQDLQQPRSYAIVVAGEPDPAMLVRIEMMTVNHYTRFIFFLHGL